MKKYFWSVFFTGFALTGFLVSSYADDATEMMDAALEAQMAAEAAPSPETPSDSTGTALAPISPVPSSVAEPVAVPAEPIRARDVLPEEQKPEEAASALDELVTDEEGNQVSAKEVILQEAAESGVLMLADFDNGDKPNNLGGDFGGWDKDPNDDTQGCRATFASDDSTGNMEGFALRLDYDVDSPSPAYNGFWMKLENVNASPYDTLSFDIRGASHHFTKRLKVELKTPDSRSSAYYINGITDQWQTIQIPLKRFKGIKDWSVLTELILVFDDVNTAPKKGTLLVDQIRFERLENGMPPKKNKIFEL